MDFIINNIDIATGIVTMASVITAATPTPKDDGVLSFFYKIVETLALIVGKAKQ